MRKLLIKLPEKFRCLKVSSFAGKKHEDIYYIPKICCTMTLISIKNVQLENMHKNEILLMLFRQLLRTKDVQNLNSFTEQKQNKKWAKNYSID